TLATGIDPVVIDAFYRAYWVEGRAISSPELITEIVRNAGHDPAEVLRKIETHAIKDDLRVRTDEALSLGIFGVPTWIVDGRHLYWGQDRMMSVEGVRPAEHATTPRPPIARTLDVYWDFSSPFAYLGSSQVVALAKRTGLTPVWRPILLGGLFRAIGTPDVP